MRGSIFPRWRRPDVVLFDWDDTLFNHDAFAVNLSDAIIKKLAPDSGLTGAELNRLWHNDKDAVCRQFFGDKTPDDILKIWDVLYKEMPKSAFSLLPGALDILDKLKAKGIRMGIVSNKSREIVMNELEHFGLTDYFEVVVGKHEDRGKRKPSPTPIIEAIKEMNIKLENIWFIGDSLDDVMAARTCAIQRFHVHHSDERRNIVKMHSEPNDPAGDIIFLNNLIEFNSYVSKIPPATALSL